MDDHLIAILTKRYAISWHERNPIEIWYYILMVTYSRCKKEKDGCIIIVVKASTLVASSFGGGSSTKMIKYRWKTSARMTQVGLKLLMEKALHFI